MTPEAWNQMRATAEDAAVDNPPAPEPAPPVSVPAPAPEKLTVVPIEGTANPADLAKIIEEINRLNSAQAEAPVTPIRDPAPDSIFKPEAKVAFLNQFRKTDPEVESVPPQDLPGATPETAPEKDLVAQITHQLDAAPPQAPELKVEARPEPKPEPNVAPKPEVVTSTKDSPKPNITAHIFGQAATPRPLMSGLQNLRMQSGVKSAAEQAISEFGNDAFDAWNPEDLGTYEERHAKLKDVVQKVVAATTKGSMREQMTPLQKEVQEAVAHLDSLEEFSKKERGVAPKKVKKLKTERKVRKTRAVRSPKVGRRLKIGAALAGGLAAL